MVSESHHLVMGELDDYLTGKVLSDTHDERYRQKIAKFLVETLGYEKSDIQKDVELKITTAGRSGNIPVDFLIRAGKYVAILIQYAPGSLVTRRLSNLALSRIVKGYQIPVVVTTNGEDAEVFWGKNGKPIGNGLSAIPAKNESVIQSLPDDPDPVDSIIADKARKIVFACCIDGACNSDGDFQCSSWYCYPNS